MPAGYSYANGNPDECLKYSGRHCMALFMPGLVFYSYSLYFMPKKSCPILCSEHTIDKYIHNYKECFT